MSNFNGSVMMKTMNVNPYEHLLKNCNLKLYEKLVGVCPSMEQTMRECTQTIINNKTIKGFGKKDSAFAHEFAWHSVGHFPPARVLKWGKHLMKYRKDLKEIGVEYPKCLFKDIMDYDEV